jgi:hypothetical protein
MSTYGKRANLAEVFSDKVDDISPGQVRGNVRNLNISSSGQ